MTLTRTIAAALVAWPLAAGSAAAQDKTLYERLGGFDRIAAIMDDFGGRLAGTDQFKRFFVGHSKDSEQRQRQLVIELFCQITGGPCVYIGRDLKTAHTGLGVTKADWDTASKMFVESLAKFKVGDKEQQELGALVGKYEKDIVEK
jgi:hemoglobin